MQTKEVRLFIYESFSQFGHAPKISDIVSKFKISEKFVREILSELASLRLIVIDQDHNILMAHPFSSVNLGFSVMGEKTLWWGGCSWDSFALPHLLKQEMLVATACPYCAVAFAWNVNTNSAPTGNQVAHFLVPTKYMWDDVVYTCSNQRIFCNEECIDAWISEKGKAKGYLMDIPTLWRFAARWYEGRMELNYERKEPSAAQEYFKEIGLTGEFWGI